MATGRLALSTNCRNTHGQVPPRSFLKKKMIKIRPGNSIFQFSLNGTPNIHTTSANAAGVISFCAFRTIFRLNGMPADTKASMLRQFQNCIHTICFQLKKTDHHPRSILTFRNPTNTHPHNSKTESRWLTRNHKPFANPHQCTPLLIVIKWIAAGENW